MKRIEVVAAVIEKGGRYFATQRGYGEFKDWWEFPGGKVEYGETRRDALIREIQEELDNVVAIDRFIATIDHDYPTFHLTMHCYLCHVSQGKLTLLEAENAKWLSKEELPTIAWLPADKKLVDILQKL